MRGEEQSNLRDSDFDCEKILVLPTETLGLSQILVLFIVEKNAQGPVSVLLKSVSVPNLLHCLEG